MNTRFAMIPGLLLSFCCIIGLSGCDMPPISKTMDMGRLEVPAGNMRIQVITIDKITDRPVEIKVEAQHLTGPGIDLYVLDKANYNLWDAEGKWISTSRKSDPIIRKVFNDDFQAVDPSLELKNFQDKVETNWIDVGSQSVLYLVACSRRKNRVTEISTIVHVREKK